MPSHFHSATKSAAVEIRKIGVLDGIASINRPERRRIEIDRLVGRRPSSPGEQIE